MVPAPKWNPVQVHPQACRGITGQQKLVVAEFLACPRRQRVLTRETKRLPLDRCLRQARAYVAVRRGLLIPGLLYLMDCEVQSLLFVEDRFPSKVAPHGFVEILQPYLIRGEEDHRVAIETRRVAAGFEDRARSLFSRIARFFRIRMFGR